MKFVISMVTVIVVVAMIVLIAGAIVFRKRATITCCGGTCSLSVLYHYLFNTLSYFWRTSPVNSFYSGD